MGNALKGTPEAWVRLDRNAKAPINRNKVVQGEQEQYDPSSPPLARSVSPCPVVAPKRQSNDFEDLPDQEIRIPDDERVAPRASHSQIGWWILWKT